MRIAVVTDAWAPQVNGVVRTLSTVINKLRTDHGMEVFVISPQNFSTLPMPTYPEIRLALKPKKRVSMLLDNLNPDAIHIATEGPLGWAARSYCLKNRIPFTTAFHTKFPEYVEARFFIPPFYAYSILHRFHNSAVRTMCTTPSMIQGLENFGFENLALWTRGVDTELFRPSPSMIDLPRPIFMNVGRVAVEKNIEEFLKCELPGSKVVVGDGPQLSELKRKYPQVQFTGALFGQDLVEHYSAADVFVFPSKTDTFGLVMLEALACGTPVAGFPVAGPIDVITDKKIGCLNDNLQQACLDALKLERSDCRNFALSKNWSASADQFLQNLEFYKETKSSKTSVSEREVWPHFEFASMF